MVIGETGVVCNWDGVEDGSNDMPTCVKGICGGHKEKDVLPFAIRVGSGRMGFARAGGINIPLSVIAMAPHVLNDAKFTGQPILALLPLPRLQLGDDFVQLTNAEWMDLIYPTNPGLPYMYDSFEWPHCT